MTVGDDEELIKGVAVWAEKMNRRRHAIAFARTSDADKEIVERDVAAEFAQSLMAEFGIELVDIESRLPPEPDCLARLNGTAITIELKELVDGELLRRIAQGHGKANEISDQELFCNAQWSIERLSQALNKLIDDNVNNPYPSDVDILLIHTDEDWLEITHAKELIEEGAIAPRSRFRSAFLLFTGGPGDSHWPLVQLYGSSPIVWSSQAGVK